MLLSAASSIGRIADDDAASPVRTSRMAATLRSSAESAAALCCRRKMSGVSACARMASSSWGDAGFTTDAGVNFPWITFMTVAAAVAAANGFFPVTIS